MRTIRDRLLPFALGLALAPAALAEDTKSTADKKDETPIVVRGVISDFTVLGEADVDETTGKVMTAEATLVTVIGHPHHDHSLTAALDKAKKEGAEAKAGKEVGIEGKEKKEMGSEGGRRRMNLYMVAITPTTKVCDVSPSGKETECKLEELEIGDVVELTFEPKMMAKSSSDKEETKPGTLKHGRHRTYLGAAIGIKLMGEAMEGEKDKK